MDINSKYSNLQCKEPQANCESNVTRENGSMLIDNCDTVYQKANFSIGSDIGYFCGTHPKGKIRIFQALLLTYPLLHSVF